jgi:hypothetical protein
MILLANNLLTAQSADSQSPDAPFPTHQLLAPIDPSVD